MITTARRAAARDLADLHAKNTVLVSGEWCDREFYTLMRPLQAASGATVPRSVVLGVRSR